MRNQNFETNYAWNSSKYNTLCQCKVITDLTHLLHYQHNIFFVVHKEAIVRVYKILCCLPRIYLVYNPIWTGVSEDGIKITIARKCLRKSFGVRRNQSISDKNAFYYFLKLNSDANKLFSNAIGRGLFTFFCSSFTKSEVQQTDFFA